MPSELQSDCGLTVEENVRSIDEHVTPIRVRCSLIGLDVPDLRADHFPELRIACTNVETSADTRALFQRANVQVRGDDPTQDVDEYFRGQSGDVRSLKEAEHRERIGGRGEKY